jgi:hypothetical protein
MVKTLSSGISRRWGNSRSQHSKKFDNTAPRERPRFLDDWVMHLSRVVTIELVLHAKRSNSVPKHFFDVVSSWNGVRQNYSWPEIPKTGPVRKPDIQSHVDGGTSG